MAGTVDDVKIAALRAAVAASPENAQAACDLGLALHETGRREEAIGWWEKAAKLDRSMVMPWRMLGAAYFNVLKDKPAAKGAYQRVINIDPTDAAVLWERDQLWKRLLISPALRLAELENYAAVVVGHDGLRLEVATILNQMGEFEKAREFLALHEPFERLDPPEKPRPGISSEAASHITGELLEALSQYAPSVRAAAAEQYRRAMIGILRLAFWRGEEAWSGFRACLDPARGFGGALPAVEQRAELNYWMGLVCKKEQDFAGAEGHWREAAREAEGAAFGVAKFYGGMALRELASDAEAEKTFVGMEKYSKELTSQPATAENYAGPPLVKTPLDEDWPRRQEVYARLLEALAVYGLHERKGARRLLGDVLRDEPNHALAADFMRWLDWT